MQGELRVKSGLKNLRKFKDIYIKERVKHHRNLDVYRKLCKLRIRSLIKPNERKSQPYNPGIELNMLTFTFRSFRHISTY